jgi:hypothetical protein
MTFAYGYTVTVTPGGTIDVYGDQAAGVGPFTIDNVGIAPQMSDEITDRGRVGVVVGVQLFVPPGAATIPADATVTIPDGAPHAGDYEVVGDPAEWTSPRTGIDRGTVVTLKRVSG